MSSNKINEELLKFLEKSPTSFHAVANIAEILGKKGFTPLTESRKWELVPGGKYYVTRNGSSILAFMIPGKDFQGFQIIASHSDSPSFKVKENPEMDKEGLYTRLNVEGYGGMLCAPWFDRPLSVAGRVAVRTENGVETRLINVDQDLLLIPSLAIHMNRKANDGQSYNMQQDLIPLYGDGKAKNSFRKLIAKEAKVSEKDLLSTDLFLYSRTKGTIWGAKGEFLSSGRLDDLQCAYASLKGFLKAENSKSIPVYAVFDNEEVGSDTKQGAASTFLKDVLHRINGALGRSEEEYQVALTGSFMVSADNAHAVHPNYADKTDPTNRPFLNGGIVIKYNANQKYTTDAVSAALFKLLCEKEKVPCQTFVNRSDMAGGSTLGNISNTQVALNTVDIGLPQLAMHSPYETAGTKDTEYLVKAAKAVFSASILVSGDGKFMKI